MDPEEQQELAEVAALARAVVDWEAELGGWGAPAVQPSEEPGAMETAWGPAERPAEAAERPAEAAERPAEAAERPADAAERPAEARPSGAGPVRSPAEVLARLTVLAEEASRCEACRLHTGRTQSVFARGSASAELMFVGEGPGFHEDAQGLPFVGPAGQLLDRMIAAMGYPPDAVYICNVVKCRPPENRTPSLDEAAACERFLSSQVELVRPRVMVALGRCATESLGLMPEGGGPWRGAMRPFRGIPVMPTYHPAFLLRSPQFKRHVWEDLQKVMALLGLPARGR